MRPDRAIWRFAFATLGWLVPCFAAWYLLAPWLARPAAWLAFHFARVYQHGLVIGWTFQDRVLAFDSAIVLQQAGGAARVLVEVDPSLYGYGMPFFVALMLASRARALPLVAGLAALVPIQAWGIAFDAIVQLGVRMGWEVAQQSGLSSFKRELAALGYQLGALVLPALAPVAIWALAQRHFIRRVITPGPAALAQARDVG